MKSVVDKVPALLAQQPDNPDLKYDAALIYRRCANLYRVLGLDAATAAEGEKLESEALDKLRALLAE